MSEILRALVEANLAAAAAIAFVLLVRRPAHGVIGVRATYLLWAIVPIAMLATLIPARTVEELGPPAYDRIVVTATVVRTGVDWMGLGMALLIMIWGAGAVALAVALGRRQAQFDREAARGKAGPAVVGFHYPRVVTPDDFDARFSYDERKLILTHEQIHIERGDSRINAVVAVVRCICWFNPLVHLGAAALIADQELSCDASVVERRPRTRRIYAETLIKTQIGAQPLPVGCHWPAHPLKDRIAMLARKPVTAGRHVMASFAVILIALGGGVAAWAAQPERTVFLDTVELFIPFHPVPAETSTDETLFRIDTEPAPVTDSATL